MNFTKMSFYINNTVEEKISNDDLFSDAVDDNLYTYEKTVLSQTFGYFYIIDEIVKFIVCLFALGSDIYLIVIISKFRNLRNRINNFLLQYAIFNMLYLVLDDLFLIIIVQLSSSGFRHATYCVIFNMDHLTLTLSFYVLLFMAVDWYMSNCHFNIYDRYPKTFKNGAYFLYAFAVPKWIATTTACFVSVDVIDLKFHLELAYFIFYLIVITCISILKRQQVLSSEARKMEYALTIPRIVLFCSVGMFTIRFISLFVEDIFQNQYLDIFYTSYKISENIFLAMPIIIVYQLAKLNKNFKTAYLKICKRKRVSDYDDDNCLDGDSIDEATHNVTFERESEVVNF